MANWFLDETTKFLTLKSGIKAWLWEYLVLKGMQIEGKSIFMVKFNDSN